MTRNDVTIKDFGHLMHFAVYLLLLLLHICCVPLYRDQQPTIWDLALAEAAKHTQCKIHMFITCVVEYYILVFVICVVQQLLSYNYLSNWWWLHF